MFTMQVVLRMRPGPDLMIRRSIEIGQPPTTRTIPMTQTMREEALAAFRAWEEKPDKIRY
jgi:hypothetical protein